MRFLILLAIMGATVAVPKHQQRIAGGEPTTVEQFPFMASMHYGWLDIVWSQMCAGTLITNNAVLSAAHFFEYDFPFNWRVILGSNDGDNGTEHQVQSMIFHPDFNSHSMVNNIVIVKLTAPAVLSQTIGLARIAGPNYILPDNTPVIAVGWGELYQLGPYPEQLQFVELNLINQEYCASQYAYLQTLPSTSTWPDITDEMICAGIVGGDKGACERDTGGPLLHANDIVFGVTSWDYECAHSVYPGVSTRVGPYAQWITDNA